MATEKQMKIFARNFNRVLELSDLSRTQFCNAMGFKYNAVCEWSNAHRFPRIDTLVKIAKFFGVSVSALTEERSEAEEKLDELSILFYSLDANLQDELVENARQMYQDNKVAVLREKFEKEWAPDYDLIPSGISESERNAVISFAKESAFKEFLKAKEGDRN